MLRAALIAQTLSLSSGAAVYALGSSATEAEVTPTAQTKSSASASTSSTSDSAKAASSAPATQSNASTANSTAAVETTLTTVELKDPAHKLAHEVILALGGMDKVKAVLDAMTLARGEMTDFSSMSGASNTVQIELLSRQEKFKIDLLVLGQSTSSGYNGFVSWQRHGADIFQSDPITTKKIAEDSSHGALLFLRLEDANVPMKILPNKVVQGKDCAALEVAGADGNPTTLYIEPETHMVLATEYMGTDFEQGSEAPKRVELSDYRPFLGSVMAYKSVEYTGGKKTSEELIKTIEVKEGIADSVFDMPARKVIEGLGKEAVVLPFEYVSNEIVVKARVNDQAELRFLLDTGATQNVMERKSATAFGTVVKSDMSLTTGSGFVTMGGIVLKSLQLGDIKLTDVPMAVADMPGFAQIKGGRPAGIIGANILRRFAITVDYEQHKVYFRDPATLTVPADATVLQAQPALGAGGLSVNAVADGKLNLRLLVDTGAAFNSISEPLLKPILDFPLLPVGSVEGVDGFKVSVGAVQLHTLALDKLSLDAPIFSVAPGAADSKMPVGLLSASSLGILGNTFWSHFKLTVDYVNGRIFLEQSPTSKATQAILQELREVSIKYHKDHSADPAIISLDRLITRANTSALIRARTQVAAFKSQVVSEKTFAVQKTDEAAIAAKAFEPAYAMARESGDNQLQSKVLADQALFILDHQPGYSDIKELQRLLQLASAFSQAEPDLLVAAAVYFGKDGSSSTRRMLDQALVQEPSNWRALVEKYRTAKRESRAGDEKQALELIHHYYPECEPGN